MRITAQLNDVVNRQPFWAERYDRDLADVFAVQDEITAPSSPRSSRSSMPRRIFSARRKSPDSLDAWGLVMRALSHFLAGDARGQSSRRRCWRKRSPSIPTTGRRSACLPPAICSAPIWAGPIWPAASAAERAALAAVVPTAKTHGRTMRWAASSVHAPLRGCAGRVRVGIASQSQFPSGPELLWPGADVLRAMGGSRRGRPPRVAAEPARSRSRRFITASPPSPSSSGAIMMRRYGWRASPSACAAITPAPTASSPLPPPWPVKPRSPWPRSRSFAARSPIFRWPGS